MQIRLATLYLALAAAPAAAQTHAKHTPAHDSAHAIALDDAQHLALHQLLVGHWIGDYSAGARHDSLDFRFEEQHDMLMVRHQGGMADFRIRGDTLSWEQPVSGTSCVIATPVAGLLAATRAPASQTPSVDGTVTCGTSRQPVRLRKRGS